MEQRVERYSSLRQDSGLVTAVTPPADWDVTFASILIRTTGDPTNVAVIVVYLTINDQFIPLTDGNLQNADRASFVVLMGSSPPMIAQRNIKLADIPGGSTLSLAAANVSSETPIDVYEIQWSIAAVNLPKCIAIKPHKSSCCGGRLHR